MSEFAKQTSVDPSKTRSEIEKTLQRYKATQFMSGWDGNKAFVGFNLRDRVIRFILKLPDRNDKVFSQTTGRSRRFRTPAQITEAWDQAVRQRWRALLLCIKAKLETVDCGIETIDEAFMSHIVLPTGYTIAETILPQLDEAYKGGPMPRLLALPAPKENQ